MEETNCVSHVYCEHEKVGYVGLGHELRGSGVMVETENTQGKRLAVTKKKKLKLP